MTNPALARNLAGRVYLRSVRPTFDTPLAIVGRFVLSKANQVQALGGGDEGALGDSDAVLDVYGVEERVALEHLHAVLTCFHLASYCEADIVGYWIADIGYLAVPGPTLVVWGHYTNNLGSEAIDFTTRHYGTVEALGLPERYSRVANALRLYTESLRTQNAELALLGFVGSLESLFSIAPQELSFRLSLLLARFLGETALVQHQWFDRAKELYTIRSKIAHGDKIADTEEAAAIQIADHWTREAEEIARSCIVRLLDFALVDLFNQRKRHEALLTNLLFIPILADAVAATTSPGA